MMSPHGMLAVYCALIFVASLAGGWLLLYMPMTHTRLQVAVSFVAGLMLGISFLHFLPDAYEQTQSIGQTMQIALAGFLAMFFLQRFFHYHHHDLTEGDPEDCCRSMHDLPPPTVCGVHAHTLADKSAQKLSWIGTALGLTLHSLIDGVALASAVEAAERGHARLAGLGVALAVILHKPFDAVAVSTLIADGGGSRRSRHIFNGLFALMTPLGALLFLAGAASFSATLPVLGYALAFCAGSFLCIAGSDLLPELQFHSHDRLKLSAALLAGLGVAILARQLEAANG